MKLGKSDPRNEMVPGIFLFVNVGDRTGGGVGTIVDGWKAGGYSEWVYGVEYGSDRTILTPPLFESFAERVG